MNNHWVLALVKGIRKPLVTSVEIEPTTSGLDLPLLSPTELRGRDNVVQLTLFPRGPNLPRAPRAPAKPLKQARHENM